MIGTNNDYIAARKRLAFLYENFWSLTVKEKAELKALIKDIEEYETPK